METTNDNGRFSLWQQLVGIATGLSVIVGVLISVTQLVGWVRDSKQANVNLRLEALEHVKEFLVADEAVRRRGRAFVKDKLPQLLPRVDQLIRDAGNGEDVYLSKDLEDFAAMHYHYEQMGAMVKLGYIEFPLIFEIIAFPDDYMKQVRPLRDALAANWKGLGTGLPDLGSNIEFLRACYENSRLANAKGPSCKTK
jgi:hypothetical protein